MREQCGAARFVAMDSMDLWINIARDSLVETIKGVDCLILNDEELEMLTEAPNFVSAAREVLTWGPTRGDRQAGQVRRGAVHATRATSRCRPTRWRTSWTRRARATASPAASSGYVAAHPGHPLDHDLLTRAMVYGTALASFNVEAFGTDRVEDLRAPEIIQRVQELQHMTTFEHQPIALRG